MDTHLARQRFLVGHAPTIADICCYAHDAEIVP
jgi:glutathione S-transferase